MAAIAGRGVWKRALVTVPAIVITGSLIGILSNSGEENGWYAALRNPAFQPPGWVFGAMWTTLYTMLGIALAMILDLPESKPRQAGLALFAAQMIVNFAWSPLFFGLHMIDLGLVLIIVMLALALATAKQFRRLAPVAGWLMLPYLAWLCLAAALNYETGRLNPGADAAPLGITEEQMIMQSENKIFDDLAKMMNGVAGTMAGMGREAESSMREKMREWVGGMDFVARDEFEAVKAMAAAARDENEVLRKRFDMLEKAAKPKAPKAPRAGA